MDTLRDRQVLEKFIKKISSIEKKSKKILIVGGTGFIGYHLAKKCLRKKWHVVSFSKK